MDFEPRASKTEAEEKFVSLYPVSRESKAGFNQQIE